MELGVRQALPEDATSVAKVLDSVIGERRYSALDTPFGEEEERSFITSLGPRGSLFVAEVNGEIVGIQTIEEYAKYTASMKHVGIIGTFVLRDCRGKGIGHALVERTFSFARQCGYEKIIVFVRATNEAALRFYRDLGFAEIGRASRQVKIEGEYDDELFLELFLEPLRRWTRP
jgi:L-amino acid N-acyltransferase YncA